MKPTPLLPPFPNGWYVLAVSSTLKKGELQTKLFAGDEVVLFRTEKGEACVIDAYCPHLGAHFGHGGKVCGECIRCPFHSFEFDTKGECTKTGYNTPAPPKAKAKVYPVRELNGFILVYHHTEGLAPDWEIPLIDSSDWMPFKWIEWELRSHPQEIAENSVDIGHFSETHGYTKVEMVKAPETNGAYLTAIYAMERQSFFGKWANPIRVQFEAHAYGLGYSFVEASTAQYGISTRHYVQTVPLEEGRVLLRIASSVKKVAQASKINPILSIFPKFLLNRILSGVIFNGYKHDVSQDFKIWENKKYIHRTPLAQGDGPIGLYRTWAKQFYTEAIPTDSLV